MNRISGNVIRKTNFNNKLSTEIKLSSLEKKIINLSEDKKNRFTKIFNYLNIALRSRYSGCEGDQNIRYFDCTKKQGNIPITLEGVTLALKNVINDITSEEVTAILTACTHNNTFIDSVTSLTKTAEKFMKNIKINSNYLELKDIRKVLDSNLKIRFKNNEFYEILLLCANNNLDNLNLEAANLSDLNMKSVSFKNTNLKNAQFVRTKLNKTKFENSNLNGANLEKANLQQANFNNTTLVKAIFYSSNLECVFYKCDITNGQFDKNTIFKNTALHSVNLSHANMESVTFNYTDFNNSTLIGTNLTNAHFITFNLDKVNLSDAKLEKTRIESPEFITRPVIKLSGADLKGAIFHKTEFQLWLPKEKNDLTAWFKDNLTKKLINTINSIDDQYNPIKINLLNQITHWLKEHRKKELLKLKLIYSRKQMNAIDSAFKKLKQSQSNFTNKLEANKMSTQYNSFISTSTSFRSEDRA